jgi:hypothetical protein
MTMRIGPTTWHPRRLRKRMRRAALVVRVAARFLLDDLVKCVSYLEYEAM